MTQVTIVSWELKGEERTGRLVSKAGLFWNVIDGETEQALKIPAKAVTDTWEENDDPVATAVDPEVAEALAEAGVAEEDIPEVAAEFAPIPSLADQAAAGPTVADPGPLMSLKELCDDQGIEPRIARRKLRAATADQLTAAGIVHAHGEGWNFPRETANIEAVMLILTSRKRG